MEENLFLTVGNDCLRIASQMLKRETTPSTATIEAVSSLVAIALSIDNSNLRWEEQSRFGAQVFPGQSFSRKPKEN